MLIGYTPLDPLVVLIGTAMAAYFLSKNPVRLMGWIPTALTIYFFIPLVTLLTLWQTVPLLLIGRLLLKGRINAPPFAMPFLLLLILAFLLSSSYALILGADSTRAAIRFIYYLGLFALFSFAFEMGRKPECQELVLRGLVILGIVLAAYGLYQILAIFTGLPLRGILRGTSGADFSFENGIPRINSLANEPKRLGYVLFLSGMAALFLARENSAREQKLKWSAYGILGMSIFTFAGSYFLAIAVFALLALLLYPSRATVWVFGLAGLALVVGILFPGLGILDAIAHGYERRLAEIEVGLDGKRVYRQELYAWDYLEQNPGAAFFGVGLGQYFSAFNRAYGVGAGLSEYGSLLPLNSNFLELLFDLSGIVAVAFYSAIVLLIIRLRFAGETFLCLALLFVTAQSLTILTLQWMVLFAALGSARLVTAPRRAVRYQLSSGQVQDTS